MSRGGSLPVTVVDTGVGNLGNLLRALGHLGATAELSADPSRVAQARCLVLPGVGAFRPPRERLRGPLEVALREALATDAALLGICVGYQLLFERSREFGETDGLGLLQGVVEALPTSLALPHIGWNRLHPTRPSPLFEGLEAGVYFYFVHSFAPLVSADSLAITHHGADFVAAAGRARVFGCQFHPEKSGEAGLRLLSNFLRFAAGDADVRPAA